MCGQISHVFKFLCASGAAPVHLHVCCTRLVTNKEAGVLHVCMCYILYEHTYVCMCVYYIHVIRMYTHTHLCVVPKPKTKTY